MVGPAPSVPITSHVIDRATRGADDRAMSNRKESRMSLFASPHFLRRVLALDAVAGAGTALLHLLGAGALAPLLGLPHGLVVASGITLIVYVATAAYLASCEPVPRGPVWALIAGNWAWVLACLALLFGGAAGTVYGQAWLVMQAVAVAVLAELEWMGVRRYPVQGWA
jgi:multisubunit Na+/H+ antiporter MnhB subunit